MDKKIISIASFSLLLCLILPFFAVSGLSQKAYAADESTPIVSSTTTITNPIGDANFKELVERVIDWIINIALVLAPLIVVYGGFTYMTAAGDPSKMSQGKNIILYAVIGFIVALLAKSLAGVLTDLVVK